MFTAFAVGLSLTASLWAQVPSYVPTNGLVGWWPFNGNANDESGNGNNGTVNGAALTTDRFGVASKAYSFNGGNQKIQTNYPGILGQNARSISMWYLCNGSEGGLMYYGLTSPGSRMNIYLYPTQTGSHSPTIDNSNSQVAHNPITPIGTWNHLVITYQPSFGTSTSSFKFYINGVLSTTEFFNYNGNQNFNTQLGDMVWFGSLAGQDLYGKIDDIGIWNRALTSTEVSDLFTGSNVGILDLNFTNELAIYPNPTNNKINFQVSNLISTGNYSIKIENNAGQQVFQSAINQAQFYVDLSTWTGNGLYFVHLIDSQNNTVTVRKIVLQ